MILIVKNQVFFYQGKADPLNSAFKLTYNMVLNLLRVEGINPEFMLERSFYQFQHFSSIPALYDSKFQSIDFLSVLYISIIQNYKLMNNNMRQLKLKMKKKLQDIIN